MGKATKRSNAARTIDSDDNESDDDDDIFSLGGAVRNHVSMYSRLATKKPEKPASSSTRGDDFDHPTDSIDVDDDNDDDDDDEQLSLLNSLRRRRNRGRGHAGKRMRGGGDACESDDDDDGTSSKRHCTGDSGAPRTVFDRPSSKSSAAHANSGDYGADADDKDEVSAGSGDGGAIDLDADNLDEVMERQRQRQERRLQRRRPRTHGPGSANLEEDVVTFDVDDEEQMSSLGDARAALVLRQAREAAALADEGTLEAEAARLAHDASVREARERDEREQQQQQQRPGVTTTTVAPQQQNEHSGPTGGNGDSTVATVVLKVRCGKDTHKMRIKQKDTLLRMLKPFCKKFNLDPRKVVMEVDGETVEENDTAATYDLEENMVVDIRIR